MRAPATWHYLPWFLVSVVTAALLVWAAFSVGWPTAGMALGSSTPRVVSVTPGGPAESAGLRPGDVLVAVNGRSVQLLPLHAGHRAGETVQVTWRRGAETHIADLRLQAADRSDLLWRLIPICVALVFWITTLVVFLRRPRNPAPRAFFALSQLVVVILTSGQLSAMHIAPATLLFALALYALPALLVRFYIILGVLKVRHARLWQIGPAVLAALLAVAHLVSIQPAAATTRLDDVLRLAPPAYAGLAILLVVIRLVMVYLQTPSAAVRRRLRGLSFGLAMGATPLVLLSLLPRLLDPEIGLPYQISFLFLGTIPITHAYVIVKHDLAKLDRLFNRSLVVFTLGLVWVALYIVAVSSALLLFGNTPVLQPVVGAVVTMAMAAFFAPVRAWLQQIVDHIFYGGWYDYRTVIAQLSHTLSGVTTRRELAERLVESITVGLRLRGAALYLREPNGDLLREHAVGLDAPLRWPKAQTPTQLQHDSSPDHELEREGGARPTWLVPLIWEGEPSGLLLLGGKRDDDFYEPADEAIVRTLQEQATLAAATVLLVDQLQQALTALEAAQQQLLEAGEQERRTLAWDLHDGPVQELVALGYRLCECRDRAWAFDSKLAEMLEEVRRESAHIMAAARLICSSLRSDVLDVMGLEPAMRRYAYDVMQKTGVVIYVDMAREGARCADPLGITLLRVYQEALNNAVAHAGVSVVWTGFSLEDGGYDLKVWDEGKGFAPPPRLESLALGGHFGILTMKERMASVGGHFELKSAPGQGVTVHAWGQVRDAYPANSSNG